ncbi:MAG: hypothetical protein K2U26_14690 [Cyclobacteriaceae bacterium]|nr:hypothetical protein [Cyclobacteriaceae bacterium]
MRRISRRYQQIKDATLSVCTLLLLVLYVAGSFPGESLHTVLHASEVKLLHSPDREKDACHQSIFHGVSEKSCEHKTHLVSFHKCPLSQVTHASDHFITAKECASITLESVSLSAFYSSQEIERSILGASSRAPPAV